MLREVNQVLAHFLTQVTASQHCGDEPGCLLAQQQQQVHAHVASMARRYLAREWTEQVFCLTRTNELVPKFSFLFL